MTQKEKEILDYMKKYNLTKEQATQLWLEDNEQLENAEIEEMTQKAKQNIKRYEQSNKKRKPVQKERKIDNVKKFLLNLCENGLQNDVEIVARKTETEINFNYEDENYTLKLTRHKKKRGVLP